jgi:hypothetical protein
MKPAIEDAILIESVSVYRSYVIHSPRIQWRFHFHFPFFFFFFSSSSSSLMILIAQVECLALLSQVAVDVDSGALSDSRLWRFTEKQKRRSSGDSASRRSVSQYFEGSVCSGSSG